MSKEIRLKVIARKNPDLRKLARALLMLVAEQQKLAAGQQPIQPSRPKETKGER